LLPVDYVPEERPPFAPADFFDTFLLEPLPRVAFFFAIEMNLPKIIDGYGFQAALVFNSTLGSSREP
jgi:hypothetical protein